MGTNATLTGQLNYESDRTATINGKELTWGVAWLYKEFVAGTLNGYNFNYGTDRVSSAVLLQDAIWFLMGDTTYMANSGTDWTNNIFLQQLDAMAGYTQAFWQSVYNPDANYGFMDGYKVFVMNVNVAPNTPPDAANVRQDVLFAVRGSDNGVPEPASLLLWSLGSLGIAGAAYRKRRTNNK